MALHVPEICFWPVKLQKTLKFLRCIHVIDLVLEYGSDIKERNWLQLLFTSLLWWIQFPPLLDWVFINCVSSFRSNFSRIALWRKTFPKAIQPWMNWFWGFCSKMVFFVDFISLRTGICNGCSVVILFDDIDLFGVYFEGYFGLLFKNAFTFQPEDFDRSIKTPEDWNAFLLSVFLCQPAFFPWK